MTRSLGWMTGSTDRWRMTARLTLLLVVVGLMSLCLYATSAMLTVSALPSVAVAAQVNVTSLSSLTREVARLRDSMQTSHWNGPLIPVIDRPATGPAPRVEKVRVPVVLSNPLEGKAIDLIKIETVYSVVVDGEMYSIGDMIDAEFRITQIGAHWLKVQDRQKQVVRIEIGN